VGEGEKRKQGRGCAKCFDVICKWQGRARAGKRESAGRAAKIPVHFLTFSHTHKQRAATLSHIIGFASPPHRNQGQRGDGTCGACVQRLGRSRRHRPISRSFLGGKVQVWKWRVQKRSELRDRNLAIRTSFCCLPLQKQPPLIQVE